VQAVCTQPPQQALFEPAAHAAERHAPRLARFRALYAALRPVFALGEC
jgi:xylulokinase